jgi:hypothetical protein
MLPGMKRPPYSLQEQIQFVEMKLKQHVARMQSSTQVILVGHSVGAYILLEILRRHRGGKAQRTPSEDMTILGGILLFPTVVDIAKSPLGVRLGWLFGLPFFAIATSLVVKLLCLFLPKFLLKSLVKGVTLMPDAGAETTTSFLQSKMGVRQALHMTKYEMVEIATDKWDDRIWGAPQSAEGTSNSNLIFYFAKDDHWVAHQTREDLIRTRGGDEDWKPQMYVDAGDVSHGFCISELAFPRRKVTYTD